MSTDEPTTPAEIFAVMPDEINVDKARGINATFQFELEGPDGGTWAVGITDGGCEVQTEAADDPEVTIKMTDKDFVALAMGEMDAVPAFLMGKINVHGDYNLATKLPVLLSD